MRFGFVKYNTYQKKYCELLKTIKWNKNKMPKYSIIEATLVENSDFNNLNERTEQIDSKMIKVSAEILDYLKTLN
jgi:hypothetical protein